MDIDVDSGLTILFLTNGPFLPAPVWVAQILGGALVLASFQHLRFLVWLGEGMAEWETIVTP